MIAPARPSSQPTQDAINEQFEQMLPRIRLMALRAFRDKDRELRDELTAEVIARAFAAFVRLAQQGRADICYATPLAMFSIKQVKSGRRLGAKMNVRDVSSEYAQLNKGISKHRLDHYDEATAEWKEIVVEDRRSGPAAIAATRIDFSAWLRTLSRREKKIAMTLANGETTGRAARTFHVSPGRISQLRRQLKDSWESFVGDALDPQPAVAAGI